MNSHADPISTTLTLLDDGEPVLSAEGRIVQTAERHAHNVERLSFGRPDERITPDSVKVGGHPPIQLARQLAVAAGDEVVFEAGHLEVYVDE